jgi:hypothetical protein
MATTISDSAVGFDTVAAAIAATAADVAIAIHCYCHRRRCCFMCKIFSTVIFHFSSRRLSLITS